MNQRLLALSCCLLLLTACAGPGRQSAVPADRQDDAVVPGLSPGIRTWGAAVNEDFDAELVAAGQREKQMLREQGHTGPLPPAHYLAISGGGSYGAYGAGLLCGWTERGDRPVFKVVTGISTGALSAPFAFLGAKYDPVLEEVYTQISTRDVLTPRGLLGGVLSDALADNAPLWTLVRKHINQELLEEIASEYRKGRLLAIGTTNLDARRAVIWNIGAIADSGEPGALQLVQQIMIASASIPAAFPPQMIDVELDGKRYQEMHVDGGAMTQVFLYPPSFHLKQEAQAHGMNRARTAYIIRNARLDPEWAETERRTLSIAGRAIASLLQTQGIGDLFRLYLNCQRDDIAYRLAFIPASFKLKEKEPFDRAFMQALFEVGRKHGLAGGQWRDEPPFMEADELPSAEQAE